MQRQQASTIASITVAVTLLVVLASLSTGPVAAVAESADGEPTAAVAESADSGPTAAHPDGGSASAAVVGGRSALDTVPDDAPTALGDPGAVATSRGLPSPNATLNVTKIYHRTPDDPDAVAVEWVITNPSVLDRPWLSAVTVDLTDLSYRNVSGFDHVAGDRYRLDPSVERASVRIHNPIGSLGIERETPSFARIRPRNVEACPGTDCHRGVAVEATTNDDRSLVTNYTYETAGSGLVTSGNGPVVGRLNATSVGATRYHPLVLLGEYDTYTAHPDGQRITLVVPDDVTLREPPRRILQSVSAAAPAVEGGTAAGPRYLVASESTNGGFTLRSGAQWAIVSADRPATTVSNVWLHEYVHTTDDVAYVDAPAAEDSLAWFHEAYATYRAMRLSLATGNGSFDRYRAVLEHGQRPHDSTYHDGYHAGPLLLAAVDRRIRRASDGRRDIDAVIDRLGERPGRVDESDLVAVVRQLTNDSTARYVARVTNDTGDSTDEIDFRRADGPPAVPTLADHQQLYGPVPNLSTTVTRVTVATDDGPVAVDTEGPVAVKPNRTVRFRVQITNDGDAAGRYALRLRRYDGTPFEGPTRQFDRANGRIEPGERETVTLAANASRRGEIRIEARRLIPRDLVQTSRSCIYDCPFETTVDPTHRLVVVPTDPSVDPATATVLREGGDHGTSDDPAVLANDSLVVQARSRQEATRGGRPPSVVHVGDRSKPVGTDGVVRFENRSLAPGEVRPVHFGPEGDRDTRYVGRVEPVVGDSVPTDADGDGHYQDLDGDGDVDSRDLVAYFRHMDDPALTRYPAAFDYSGNDAIDYVDLIAVGERALD